MSPISPLRRDPAFQAWFAGSACTAADGAPLMLLHATDAAPFQVFQRTQDVGFHFGTAETVNGLFRNWLDAGLTPNGQQVIPVVCRARTPLRVPDLHTWDPFALAGVLVDRGALTADELDRLTAADDVIDDGLLAALERQGHDALVYDNATEGGGLSWLVWDPCLVKSVFADRWDRTDPRLTPQAPMTPQDRRDQAATEAARVARRTARHQLDGAPARPLPGLPAEATKPCTI